MPDVLGYAEDKNNFNIHHHNILSPNPEYASPNAGSIGIEPAGEKYTLSADDPIERVLIHMAKLNRSKRNDYAAADDPFSNFKDSASQVGQAAGFACEILIGTKQSRLKQLLWSGRKPNNESVYDTLIDRAVYCVLAVAMYTVGLYE